jgi:hypothetical protein
MWSYYGSKNKIAKFYPPPIFDTIIEPFAGAAYYSLRYFERAVVLIDKNPDIILMWRYLQNCSLKDLDALPLLNAGEKITEKDFDCYAQYRLMRFLIVQAAFGGNNTVSKWGAMRLQANINRLKKHHFKIKHWKFIEGDYSLASDVKATWFIDPPYTNGGHKYPMSNRKINFEDLSNWCRSRKGQQIVCENNKATWLNFVPLVALDGVKHRTMESIYTNMPSSFAVDQQKLF